MKRKLFALFFALAASIGLSWGTEVTSPTAITWDESVISSIELYEVNDSFTNSGITIQMTERQFGGGFYLSKFSTGGQATFVFSSTVGDITGITINAGSVQLNFTGWGGDQTTATWSGTPSSSVTASATPFIDIDQISSIVFTIGPAPEAEPQRYTAPVKAEDLIVGDTLAQGALLSTQKYEGFWFATGRARYHGQVVTMDYPCSFERLGAVSKHGAIASEAMGHGGCYEPINENGQLGEEWVVTSVSPFTIAGIGTAVITNTNYTSAVDYAVIEPGDTLSEGALIQNGPTIYWMLQDRVYYNDIPRDESDTYLERYHTFGQNGVFEDGGGIIKPRNEQGEEGSKWLVVYYSPLTLAGIGAPSMTLTLAENVSIVGLPIEGITDKGNGVYEVVKGTVFSVQVAEPEHYTFDHWADLGSADPQYSANPRTITMTGNMNLTPVYNIDTYSLTIGVNDPARGSVKIAPTTRKVVWSKEHLQTIYEWKYNNPRAVAWEEHRNNEKDGISINATPIVSEVGLMSDSYYDFKPLMFFYDVNASITFNSNIYTFNSIEIYGEHTANFNGWTYNTAKGCYQVSGLGNTVSLTPTEGAEIYQFVDSIIFYANIALPQGVTPTETPGVYTVEWGSEISFVATPASEEYYLAKWNDQPATNDTLTLTITGEQTVSATFAHVPYIITLPESVSILGLPIEGITDNGDGTYAIVEGTEFQVQATASEHQQFDHWGELGSDDPQYAANPRTITMTGSLNLNPVYSLEKFTLTLATNDSTKGIVKVLGATPTVMEGVKQVGSGNETAPIPIVQPNWYSVSQQLYTSEEIGGKPGTIESIAYYAIGAQSRYLEIYITATDRSVYNSKSDILPIREGVLVFEGYVNFVADDWTPITFKEPLEYNGKDNLAITVFDESGSSCSLLFRSFTTTGTQAAYLSSTVPHYNYQINNFNFMTKSGNKPIKSQILFNFASAPVSAEAVPFDAPASWNGDATYITAADLPGFAPISNDEALALSQTIWVEESGLLIFGFDGEYTYSVLMDGGYREILYQPYTRGYIYSSINNYSTSVFYTTAAATGIIDNGDGTYSVDYGTEINLLAEPAEDHYLVSWNDEPALSDTLKITFTGDQSVTATFAHVPYIYTLPEGLSIVGLPIEGIEDKGNGVYEIEPGTEFQVSANIPEHYHIAGWADLDAEDAAYLANPRTLTADSTMTLEPIFAIDTYTLTLATNDSTKGVVKVLGGAGGVRETIILKNKGAEDPIQGEYFQVSGGGTDNFGRYIGKMKGYSLTISSLNGEMIDSISFSVTATSMWSGYTVSSTSGEVVDNVFGNYTFKVKNINATSVTISRIGDGDPSGSITVDVIYVNQDMPVRAEITDMEFPTSGNTLTINDMTLTVGSFDLNTPKITGGGTFTTDLGEFTAISIYSYGFDGFAGEGWTGDMYTQRWTGQSSSVSFEGMVFGDGIGSITITYTIVPAPAATGGIVDNGDGTYTVDWGTELTFVAQPAEDHHLVSWNDEPALSDTLKLTMEGELSVSATFAHDPYVYTLPETVSMVEPLPAGVTDKGNGVYEIEPGTEFQVSANIPEHYHIAGWADLDAEDAAYLANPRTLTADSTMTLEPIFAIDTYTLTLATNDSTKGIVSVEGAGAGVDIVWDANFWNGIQAYMNGEDIVHVNNSKDGITITFDGGDFENGLKDGKIKLDNSDNKLIFTSTVGEFTKIFLKGYVPGNAPEGWDRVAGLIWEATPSATVELPGSAALVEFEEAVFTLTSAASGIVDNGDGTYTVDWGTELTFIAQPAENYHLDSWWNSGFAETGDTLKITLEGDTTVNAYFKHDTYILSVEGTEIETAKFYDGTDSVVVLNPGTLIGVVEGDSVLLTTTANYSSANIGEDLTITVHYDIKVVSTQDDYEYALAITDSIYPIKGFIIEPLTPDSTADTEDEEAENKEGLEIYAYGYCHGSSYSINYHLKSGNPDQYKIDFADARFTDVDWTDLTTNGADGTIDVEIPVDLPTGDYSMTVTFRDSRFTWLESEPITVSLHVNLPETYVAVLFDNVVAVVDTCECLTDIQWYWRADATQAWQLIEGATGYYYKQEGGLSGEYFIKAKMNGIDTYTCPQTDVETLYGDGQQAKVSAYPNPVLNTTTVTIDNSRAWNHTIRIVNLMGNEMMTGSFEGNETTIDMSGYSIGNYMISVDGIVVKVMKK